MPTTSAAVQFPAVPPCHYEANQPAVPRCTFTTDEARSIYDTFLANGGAEAQVNGRGDQPGMLAAQYEVYRLRGHFVSFIQLVTTIGRHAFLLGMPYGDQRALRRMEAAGRLTSTRPNRMWNVTRGFGIEIEFNDGRSRELRYNDDIKSNVVRDACYRGLNAELQHYNHSTTGMWKMVTDATVSGGEFVSPILRTNRDGFHQMREALRAVKAQGGVAGESQGMHIHHDVRDFTQDDMRRLVANLRQAEVAMLAYVPAYRYDGRGSCRAVRINERHWNLLERAALDGSLSPARGGNRGGCWERYVSFNFNATLAYGSVEFRALGNTLNPVKIKTWVMVGAALIAFTKEGHTFDAEVTSEQMVERLVGVGLLPQDEATRFLSVVANRRNRIAQGRAA